MSSVWSIRHCRLYLFVLGVKATSFCNPDCTACLEFLPGCCSLSPAGRLGFLTPGLPCYSGLLSSPGTDCAGLCDLQGGAMLVLFFCICAVGLLTTRERAGFGLGLYNSTKTINISANVFV